MAEGMKGAGKRQPRRPTECLDEPSNVVQTLLHSLHPSVGVADPKSQFGSPISCGDVHSHTACFFCTLAAEERQASE